MASIHKKPVVTLVAKTEIDRAKIEKFLRETWNEEFSKTIDAAFEAGLSGMEVLVSMMAKLCYKSLTLGHNANVSRVRDIRSNIEAAIQSGHGSVLEHASMSFIVHDCSRIFTHELVRHRAGTAYCLSGDAVVWSGSKLNGAWCGIRKRWTMKSLFEWSQDKKRKGRIKLMTVRCFDGAEFVQAGIKSVTCSGVKPVFLMTLANGRSIKASSQHRFMARHNGVEGWHTLGDLQPGSFVATNGRKVSVPDREAIRSRYHELEMTRDEIAKEYSVSGTLVGKWIRMYGLGKPESGRFKKGAVPHNKGKKCQHSYSHTDEAKRRMSEAKTGVLNPQYKDGITRKRKTARSHKKDSCETCGSTVDLHAHHKDRNHFNDSPENIQTLCNSCHQKLHYAEDGSQTALVVRWSEVKSIEYVGEEMTYDIEVDHPAHNFVANGIVTHNSQNSGRFIRLDSIDIVVDPLLQPVEADVQEIAEYLEAKYAAMSEKLGLTGDKLPFDRKKKLTSALRRIAPNGQTNEIGFTVNLRALRFVILKRTDRHAEWEIRSVFEQVYRIAKEIVPTLFCDATEEVVDGIVEVKFACHT